MATRIGGNRRKTRNIFKKHYKSKGKVSLTSYFKEYKKGDKVILKAESAIQKGLYFPRYHGKSGIVKSRKGDCYEILIKDGKLEKNITVHPIHLKQIK
jgi:large subunit ribosomal protein L21e